MEGNPFKPRGKIALAVYVFFVAVLVLVCNIPSGVRKMWTSLGDIHPRKGVLDSIAEMSGSNNTSTDYAEVEAYLARRAIKVSEVDCNKMLNGDPKELRLAEHVEHRASPVTQDKVIKHAASSCSSFIERYGFITRHLTDRENHFPIAFSILTFRQASQVVGLLRAIYRPQNFYCIHVDRKSSPQFLQALQAVSRCFPNVFLASRSVDVRWGGFSVLKPEVVCMKDLWQNQTWRYFINLTGQEFPLKTNYELVRILTALNGSNDVMGSVQPRFAVRWKQQLPAPHNISLYKGAVHVTLSRGFVDYVLHSGQGQDFYHWCRPTRHPDEHFFNSLNYNPHLHVPGSYKGNLSLGRRPPYITRYKNWARQSTCPGKRIVRGICILNVLSLPVLNRTPELFANKFYEDYSRLALRCLAEKLHNRTRDETLGRLEFNVSSYEKLYSSWNTF